MKFRETTLSNGLRIVAEVNPQAYSCGFGFFVRTGARDETLEVAGVSHFLEHMAFKGTPRRSAADVNRELDEIGSMSNAETSEEHTAYYAVVLPEYQERAVDLLADMMRPSIRDEDFVTEKKVILEEIAKYDDQPPFGAFEKAVASHYGEHPLGRPVLGTADSVTALTSDQMRSYFRRHYSPNNMALAAAGRLDFEALVAQAERMCGEWEPFEVARDISRPATNNTLLSLNHEVAHQQYLVRLWDGPSAESPDRYVARLLYRVLGDDAGSRLYWELVDTGRAEYAALFPHEYQGAGLAIGYLCCAPEDGPRNLEDFERVLAEARKGIELEELQRAQNKACAALVRASERPRNRLFAVGHRWLGRLPYQTVRESLEVYRAVTLDDLNRVLHEYPLADGTTVSVTPQLGESDEE